MTPKIPRSVASIPAVCSSLLVLLGCGVLTGPKLSSSYSLVRLNGQALPFVLDGSVTDSSRKVLEITSETITFDAGVQFTRHTILRSTEDTIVRTSIVEAHGSFERDGSKVILSYDSGAVTVLEIRADGENLFTVSDPRERAFGTAILRIAEYHRGTPGVVPY